MSDAHSPAESKSKYKTTRAIAASRDAAHKHKYALSFWMFAGFVVYITFFMPLV